MLFVLINIMYYSHGFACCKGVYTPEYARRSVSSHAAAPVHQCKQPLRAPHMPAATIRGRRTQCYSSYWLSIAYSLGIAMDQDISGTPHTEYCCGTLLCGHRCCRRHCTAAMRQQILQPAQHWHARQLHLPHACTSFTPHTAQQLLWPTLLL
jgi:hypothetical protein